MIFDRPCGFSYSSTWFLLSDGLPCHTTDNCNQSCKLRSMRIFPPLGSNATGYDCFLSISGKPCCVSSFSALLLIMIVTRLQWSSSSVSVSLFSICCSQYGGWAAVNCIENLDLTVGETKQNCQRNEVKLTYYHDERNRR